MPKSLIYNKAMNIKHSLIINPVSSYDVLLNKRYFFSQINFSTLRSILGQYFTCSEINNFFQPNCLDNKHKKSLIFFMEQEYINFRKMGGFIND